MQSSSWSPVVRCPQSAPGPGSRSLVSCLAEGVAELASLGQRRGRPGLRLGGRLRDPRPGLDVLDGGVESIHQALELDLGEVDVGPVRPPDHPDRLRVGDPLAGPLQRRPVGPGHAHHRVTLDLGPGPLDQRPTRPADGASDSVQAAVLEHLAARRLVQVGQLGGGDPLEQPVEPGLPSVALAPQVVQVLAVHLGDGPVLGPLDGRHLGEMRVGQMVPLLCPRRVVVPPDPLQVGSLDEVHLRPRLRVPGGRVDDLHQVTPHLGAVALAERPLGDEPMPGLQLRLGAGLDLARRGPTLGRLALLVLPGVASTSVPAVNLVRGVTPHLLGVLADCLDGPPLVLVLPLLLALLALLLAPLRESAGDRGVHLAAASQLSVELEGPLARELLAEPHLVADDRQQDTLAGVTGRRLGHPRREGGDGQDGPVRDLAHPSRAPGEPLRLALDHGALPGRFQAHHVVQGVRVHVVRDALDRGDVDVLAHGVPPMQSVGHPSGMLGWSIDRAPRGGQSGASCAGPGVESSTCFPVRTGAVPASVASPIRLSRPGRPLPPPTERDIATPVPELTP